MPVAAYILVALAAYLLGSIPTGFLVARVKGIDIRSVGSGNIGATNTMRALGKPAGILVFLGDALKGFAAVALAGVICRQLNELLPNVFTDAAVADATVRGNLGALGGLFAVLGHNYTCWLKFKGGKGVATSAGVYLALAPGSVAIAIGTWVLVFVVTRYVSLASIAAAVALSAAVWIREGNLLLGLLTTGIGALAIYKHRTNIQRLRAGTESRTSFRKEKTAV